MNSMKKKELRKEIFQELPLELKPYLLPLLILMVFFIFISIQDETKIEILIEKGNQYTNRCQLIETNIDNGLFQSNTNKLKCGDVIENVSVDEYQEAIKAYKKSQANR